MDKKQIQSITTLYSRLQGLRAIPIGLLLFTISVWAISNHGPTTNLTIPILATGIAIIVYGAIDLYYKKNYGQVKQTRQQKIRETLFSILFGLLALVAFWVDTAVFLSISAIGLIFFIALGFEYFKAISTVKRVTLTSYLENSLAALIMLIFSLLPILGIDWWNPLGLQAQILGILMLAGILTTITGIIGHVRITFALPIREA